MHEYDDEQEDEGPEYEPAPRCRVCGYSLDWCDHCGTCSCYCLCWTPPGTFSWKGDSEYALWHDEYNQGLRGGRKIETITPLEVWL